MDDAKMIMDMNSLDSFISSGWMFLPSFQAFMLSFDIFDDSRNGCSHLQNSKINWRSFSPKSLKHMDLWKPSPSVFSYHVYMDFPWDSFWQKVFANTNCLRYIICRWASLNWHNYIQRGIYVGLVIPWFLSNKLCINNFTLSKKVSCYTMPLAFHWNSRAKLHSRIFHIQKIIKDILPAIITEVVFNVMHPTT